MNEFEISQGKKREFEISGLYEQLYLVAGIMVQDEKASFRVAAFASYERLPSVTKKLERLGHSQEQIETNVFDMLQDYFSESQFSEDYERHYQ